MASMSFTLTIGGVQFCLDPSSPDSKSIPLPVNTSNVPPMISIQPKSNSSENENGVEDESPDVTAMLNCFTGTLRISLVQSGSESPGCSAVDKYCYENHETRDIDEDSVGAVKVDAIQRDVSFNQKTSNLRRFSTASSKENNSFRYGRFESNGRFGEDELSMDSKNQNIDLEGNNCQKHEYTINDREQVMSYEGQPMPDLIMKKSSLHKDISSYTLPSFSKTTLNRGLYSTRLHTECGRPDASITDLIDLLTSHPSYAFETDINGKLPIHIFTDNKELIESNLVESEAFVWKLLRQHPDSVITMDNEGNKPLTYAIQHWMHRINEECTGANIPIENHNVPYYLPSSVDLSHNIKWSLNILSLIIDNTEDHLPENKRQCYTDDILDVILNIPYLIQAILLVKDRHMRNSIFAMSIFRRIILSKKAMGGWICSMMKASRQAQTGAIELLEMITDPKIKCFIGTRKYPRASDVLWFDQSQRDTIDAVSNIDGFINSMFRLETANIDRISQTSVVQEIINRKMMTDHVVAKVLLEATMMLMLQISYRIFLRMEIAVIEGGNFSSYTPLKVPLWLLVVISGTYFLFADVLSMGLMTADPKIFVGMLFKPWNMVDLLATTLSIGSALSVAFSRNLAPSWVYTITLFFIWMKMLGFLKTINVDLATYIFALAKITVDIRWFLVVLVAFMLVLADVHYVDSLFTTCANANTGCVLYHVRMMDAFLLLIGEGSFQDVGLSEVGRFLSVVLTFAIVIILLNVLIAVISDSYTRANNDSEKLFGRARLMFLIKHVSLEKVFAPITRLGFARDNPLEHGYMKIRVRSIQRWFLMAMLMLLIAVVNGVLYLASSQWSNKSALIELMIYSGWALGGIYFLWGLFDVIMMIMMNIVLKWCGIDLCLMLGPVGTKIELILDFPLRVTAKYLIDIDANGTDKVDDDWDAHNKYIIEELQEI